MVNNWLLSPEHFCVAADGYTRLVDVSTPRWTLSDESRPIVGFIPAETPVHNGIAGDNGTAGVTLNQPALDFLVG